MESVGKTGYYRISLSVLIFFLIYLCNCVVIPEKLSIWTDSPGSHDTTHTTYNITTSRTSWWDGAQSGCSQFGGHLYIPQSKHLPGVILTQMQWQWNVYYWVGAVKYPTWTWTSLTRRNDYKRFNIAIDNQAMAVTWLDRMTDQSTLYTYVGYVRLPLYRQKMSSLDGNCVLTCHQHCSGEYTLFGLRGNDCYCVGSQLDGVESNHSEVRCPGNYDEYCGDDVGISLYKLENISIVPGSSDRCGFVSVSTIQPHTRNPYSCHSINFYQTLYYPTIRLVNDCNVSRMSACEKNIQKHTSEYWQQWMCRGNICVSKTKHNFENCDLVKVTPSNIGDLCHAMVWNVWHPVRNTYWIGLKRNSDQKWINGSDMRPFVHDNYYDVDVLPTCLAVSKTGTNTVQFSWIRCQEKHMSICETMKVTTTNPPTRVSTHTTNTPSRMSAHVTTTPPPPTSGHSSTPGTEGPSSTQATSKHHTGRVATSVQQDSSNTGIYIGCAIAAVVAVASLILLLISYRQRRLCFKDKASVPVRGHVRFNAGVDNATYAVAGGSPEDQDGLNMPRSSDSSPHYAVIPVATVTPNNHVHLTSSRRDAENQKDYYNIKPGENTLNSRVSGSQETTDDGDYVVPKVRKSKTTEKHTMSTKPTAHYQNTDEADYAVPHPRGVDEVDGTREDDDAGIYHFAGEVEEKDDVYRIPSVTGNRETTNVEAPYNTLWQDLDLRGAETGAYDRVIHPSQRHDYDTASPAGRLEFGVNAYNHVGQVDVDADDNYDSTRHRQQQRRLGDYSHADGLNVVLEDSDDGGEVDDTYHYINDTEEADATHGTVQHVYSNTGYSHPQVADDDADYYNLPFVAGDDISNDPTEQQDDMVYSLARTVSDA